MLSIGAQKNGRDKARGARATACIIGIMRHTHSSAHPYSRMELRFTCFTGSLISSQKATSLDYKNELQSIGIGSDLPTHSVGFTFVLFEAPVGESRPILQLMV